MDNVTVYMVIGAWVETGYSPTTVQLFRDADEAQAYGEALVTVGGFDYFDIVEREVPPAPAA